MENPTQQTSESAKKTPKKPFRINFYGFLIIVAFLLVAVGSLALRMQGELQSFHDTKQAQRASIADIKAESKKIDAVWQALSPMSLLSYSSAEQECIKGEDGEAFGTCLPGSIFAKLTVTSHQPVLVAADALVAHFEKSGWKQRNYTIKTTDADKPRQEFATLPAHFQNVRFYYTSPQAGDARRCASFIYSSKDAQTPGWSGYLGRCTE